MLGFLGTFLLTQMERISADFYSQIFERFLFLALVLCAGEPSVGLDPLLLMGDLCS